MCRERPGPVRSGSRGSSGIPGELPSRRSHHCTGAIPCRDAVSPPYLAAYAPVLEVFQPVEVIFFPFGRDNFGLTLLAPHQWRLRQEVWSQRTTEAKASARPRYGSGSSARPGDCRVPFLQDSRLFQGLLESACGSQTGPFRHRGRSVRS